jgi:hypothetical protein
MCGCKRSFGTFAAPLSPFKSEFFDIISTPPGPEDRTEDQTEDQTEEVDFEEPTIGELIAVGSDVADITTRISDLTNKVHPIFRDDNFCVCRYADVNSCVAPYLAANPERLADKKKAPVIASPYPADNFVVRMILQLATMFLTQEDTLPFWAGILDCARGPRQSVPRFHAHPRKKLSRARREDTLEQLNKFADEVRIHFKEFEGDDCDGTSDGLTNCFRVSKEDPDYDPIKSEFHHDTCHMATTLLCDCYKGSYYAYKDGRAVVEDGRFQHIFLNTKAIVGFDQSSDQWRDATIWDLQAGIFVYANTVCHEFAHAFLDHHVQRDAFMNDECLSETGFSWEHFTFGGLIHQPRGHSTVFIFPWPNLQYFEHYMRIGGTMDIRYFGKLEEARDLIVEPWQHEKFLDQSFWDEEQPSKAFKKMWLRPYCETAAHEAEYTRFSSGHEAPVEVSAKKQRLSDAAMERQRAYASKVRRSERMARADRWHRCKEMLLERKADFHDRAKDRLDALWTSCTPAAGEKPFQ